MSTDLSKKFFKGAAEPVQISEKDKVRIETPRMIIREIEPGDVQRFWEISNEPGFYYYCFDGSREAAQAFVDNAIANQGVDKTTGKRESYVLAVELKSTGECIGHVAIEPVDFWKPEAEAKITFRPETTEAQKAINRAAKYEINYFIDPKHQNGGLGSEALINIAHHAFTGLGIPAMSSTQHPANTVALHNAQHKIGYLPIGDTHIDTTNGVEPRVLSICTPAYFYERRKFDRVPQIMGYNPAMGVPAPKAPAP